jgi:predicted phosphodiesterase
MPATVTVTRPAAEVRRAVVRRGDDADDVEVTGTDLFALQEKVAELLGDVADGARWVFPDDDVRLKLTDDDSGTWLVTTSRGSAFYLDLGSVPRRVVRIPAPQRDSNGRIHTNRHSGDEQAGELYSLGQVEVGRGASLFRSYPHEPRRALPYTSTTIRSIVRAAFPDAGPGRGLLMVFGDVHGDIGWIKRLAERAHRLRIDTLVSVGDFGIGPFAGDPAGTPFERKVQRIAAKNGVTIYVVPGNHSNYATIAKLHARPDGWLELSPNTLVAPRGHRWTWAGVRFGAIGGAFSVDHSFRTPGRDWWPGVEEVRPEDLEALGDGELDVLVTHDVPAGVPLLSAFKLNDSDAARAQVSRDLLGEAVSRTSPEVVFCGHHHQRRSFNLELPAGTRGERAGVGERHGLYVGQPPVDVSRVEVLDMEQTDVNYVVFNLADLTLTEQRVIEARTRSRDRD